MIGTVTSVLAASSYRLVYLLAAGLVLLGIGMAMLTVWLVRTTRPDPEVLARLEVMGTRRWWRAGTIARAQALDAVRRAAPHDDEGEAGTDVDAIEGDEDEVAELLEGSGENGEGGARDPSVGDHTPDKGLGRRAFRDRGPAELSP